MGWVQPPWLARGPQPCRSLCRDALRHPGPTCASSPKVVACLPTVASTDAPGRNVRVCVEFGQVASAGCTAACRMMHATTLLLLPRNRDPAAP